MHMQKHKPLFRPLLLGLPFVSPNELRDSSKRQTTFQDVTPFHSVMLPCGMSGQLGFFQAAFFFSQKNYHFNFFHPKNFAFALFNLFLFHFCFFFAISECFMQFHSNFFNLISFAFFGIYECLHPAVSEARRTWHNAAKHSSFWTPS